MELKVACRRLLTDVLIDKLDREGFGLCKFHVFEAQGRSVPAAWALCGVRHTATGSHRAGQFPGQEVASAPTRLLDSQLVRFLRSPGLRVEARRCHEREATRPRRPRRSEL